jgi:hypothetical protein
MKPSKVFSTAHNVAKTLDEAHEIMHGLPEDRAQLDLHAAFVFLASQQT